MFTVLPFVNPNALIRLYDSALYVFVHSFYLLSNLQLLMYRAFPARINKIQCNLLWEFKDSILYEICLTGCNTFQSNILLKQPPAIDVCVLGLLYTHLGIFYTNWHRFFTGRCYWAIVYHWRDYHDVSFTHTRNSAGNERLESLSNKKELLVVSNCLMKR